MHALRDQTVYPLAVVAIAALTVARPGSRSGISRSFARAGFASLALATWWVAASTLALAQAYPAKPIRLIVGFAPGGNVDNTARALGPAITDSQGQPVLIENRAGAGGSVGAEFVARAPGDGYTLLMGSSSLAVNVTLYTNLSFDATKDLIAVAPVSLVPIVLTVHPSVPAKNAKEYVAIAKQRKGRITYASAGTGTSNHLTGELMRSVTGIDIIHVPYKGSGAALGDLIGGQVDSMFDQLNSSLPFIRAGKIRVIAVTSAKRSSLLPDVQTLAEQGIAGVDASTFLGVFAPGTTPRDIVTRLNGAVQKTTRSAAFREKLNAFGADALEGSPEEFSRMFRDEVVKWGKIVKASGAKAE
ncbi:MAG: tripartite tricarboxylate transporter substrate binding protein [Proteobacteria bacterium]|nr:tripartite tricarboxylate transporter substrate binding protein [Burkholderiales bacterium]